MSRLISFLTGGESARRRIGVTVMATGLARLATVAYNIFLVPILLSAWGVQTYGEWIVLTALAAMASLSNVGFVSASLSEMILRVSAGEREEAARVLSTTLVGLVCLVAVVFALGTAFLMSVASGTFFGVRAVPLADARLIVDLSLASVLLGFFPGALSAPVSAVAGAGISQMVVMFAKLGEMAVIAALAFAGYGPVVVTAVPVASAILQSLTYVALTRRFAPWLPISPFLFDRKTFARLLHPSLGQFLLFASCNIIAIQMPRILLGHLAGAAGVALFSVAVTYTRAAKMLTSVVAQSFQVELTRAYGEGRYALTARLVETICQMGLWLTGAATLAGIVLAGPLFHVWTRGKLEADHLLIAILGITCIVNAYNDGFMYLLTGINRVWSIATGHLAASLVALTLGVALFPHTGLYGVAAALMLPDLTVAVVGISDTGRSLHADRRVFFRQSLRLPLDSMRAEAGRALALVARTLRQ